MASTLESGMNDDLSTLSWVYDELRRSLENAHKALHRYLKEAEAAGASDVEAVDPAVLRIARTQIHQSVGALELVGLGVAANPLRASEAALARLASRPKLITAAAVRTIEQGSFALLDFLSRRLAGKQISPLAMFPQYRALQELAGATRVHPADLWSREWQWQTLPAEPGVEPREADEGTLSKVESELLWLMRGPAPAAATRMSALFAGLGATAQTELATLWRLAAAFFEAHAKGLLPTDLFSKRVGSRLLAQLRAGQRAEASDRLAQDLLFFCSQAAVSDAKPAGPRLAQVRRAFGLENEPSIDYETPRLGRFDPAWIAQARKRVAAAKECWSAVAAGELARLPGLTEPFSLVGDSLTRLYTNGDALAQSLQGASSQALNTNTEPPPELAMEVATALLYIDASLEDGDFDHPDMPQRVQRLAQRIDDVRQGRDPGPLERWMEDLYRRVSDRQTMGSVVQELRSSLSEVEKQIDQYFRNPAQRELLIPVPAQLQAMRGVLSVLGMEQASQAVLRMRDEVDELANTEVDAARAAEVGTFDRLADNLGALSFLIDMVSVQPQLAKSLFRFDPVTGNLSAVMERAERSSSFADLDTVADDAPALVEQAQSLVQAASQPGADAEQLTREFERLSQQARAADQTALAEAASRAHTTLAHAPAAGQALDTAARQLDASLTDFAASQTDAMPTQLEPLRQVPPAGPPTAPGETGLEDDAEMREIFLEEAREVIETARGALQDLQDKHDDMAAMTTVRRAFHTLKGSSRMVGLNEFGEAAWACEQLFNARLAESAHADADLRGFSAEVMNHFESWVAALEANQAGPFRHEPVSRAADALRLEHRRIPLHVEPEAAAPVAADELHIDLPADAGIELVQAPPAEATELPIPEIALPDVAEVIELSAPPEIAALPELVATAEVLEVPEVVDMASLVDLSAPAGDARAPHAAQPPEAPVQIDTLPELTLTLDGEDLAVAATEARPVDQLPSLEALVPDLPQASDLDLTRPLPVLGDELTLAKQPLPSAEPDKSAALVDLDQPDFELTLPDTVDLTPVPDPVPEPLDDLVLDFDLDPAPAAASQVQATEAPLEALALPVEPASESAPVEPEVIEAAPADVLSMELPAAEDLQTEAAVPATAVAESHDDALAAAPLPDLAEVIEPSAWDGVLAGVELPSSAEKPGDAPAEPHVEPQVEPTTEHAALDLSASAFVDPDSIDTVAAPLTMDLAVPDVLAADHAAVELPVAEVAADATTESAPDALEVLELPVQPAAALDDMHGAAPVVPAQTVEVSEPAEPTDPNDLPPVAEASELPAEMADDLVLEAPVDLAIDALPSTMVAAEPVSASDLAPESLPLSPADALLESHEIAPPEPLAEDLLSNEVAEAADIEPAATAPAELSELPPEIDLSMPLDAVQEPVANLAIEPQAPALADPEQVAEVIAAAPADQLIEPPASAVDIPADAAELDESEQVKVIGDLRINIPLFNIYLNEADELSRRLSTELAEWSHEQHRAVGDSAVALAHSLAGSSATVGYADLSQLARSLEHALMRSNDRGHGRGDEAVIFNHAAEEIRRLLHQFAAGFLRAAEPGLLQRVSELEHAPLETSLLLSEDLDSSGQQDAVDTGMTPLLGDFGQPALMPFSALPDAPARPAVVRSDALDTDDDIDAVDAIDEELFPIFEEEGEELIPQLQARLRDWVRRPGEASAASACMRTLHTLKGGARLAGAMHLGEMAHRLETAIEHLLATDHPQADDIEPLVGRADAIEAHFEALRRGGGIVPPTSIHGGLDELPEHAVEPLTGRVVETVIQPDLDTSPAPLMPLQPLPALEPVTPQPLFEAGTGAEAAEPAVNRPVAGPRHIDWARFDRGARVADDADARKTTGAHTAAVRVRAPLLDRLVNHAGEVTITRARIESDVVQMKASLGDLTENLERLRRQLRDIELQAETQIGTRMEAARQALQEFDPLEMDRFTRFQELTRMMAESVNDVATVQRGLQRTLQSAEDELATQARLTRDLQDDLLRTRMVEFEGLSERLYRVVRQAAKETGKQVRLDIIGGSIEIDRGVLDRMTGSFEHLLRNSVVHGIEAPQDRQASGKEATGSITISVTQEGNEVGVDFRDDGGGLNLRRIAEKARATGLLTPLAQPSEAELAGLIFHPGFSTADEVTGLAGRGVGMDVVRADVNAMGGRIETATAAGQGTSFKLVLPLTTAVTQVVMLRCADLTVAVPSTLVEIVRRAPLAELNQAYQQGSYAVGGQDLPFFWLGALLQGTAFGQATGRTAPVVVIRSAAQRLVLHVDEVVGNQEVVVKNLGPQLSRLPGLTGMTLLPSGQPALIYNPVALATLYGASARSATVAAMEAARRDAERIVEQQKAEQAPLVLVVDDSLTVRRVSQRLLQREGYRVAIAKDGLEGLERLADELPSVVLTDIEMPRMDGFDLVRNMRVDERLAKLPVIMITSRIAQKHRDYAAELGVNHYLGKPFAEDELLALVANYAGRVAPA